MNQPYVLSAFALTLITAMSMAVTAAEPAVVNPLVKDIYPTLTSGALSSANLGSLPAGVILQAGVIKITQKEIDAEIAKSPAAGRVEMKRNQFFLLENQATRKLIELEANTWSKMTKPNPPLKATELVQAYLMDVVKGLTVSDEENKLFFDQNREVVGTASYDEVKAELRDYVLTQKRQEAIDAYITTLGQRCKVIVNAAWTAKQSVMAMDDPVDKARRSGKVTMVDLGADGCAPCEMMTPILAELKTEYAAKANIVFVHVRQEQLLAARFSVQSIPTQIFFDAQGKQVYRHVGFLAKQKIIDKLAEIGVK